MAPLVCTDAFDGWPLVPSTNGLLHVQRDPRNDSRLFVESWSSTRTRKLFCPFLYGTVNDWPGSVDGLLKNVPGSRSYSYDAKTCSLSLTIGPPNVPPSCWFAYGSTRLATGSGAFNESSRK